MNTIQKALQKGRDKGSKKKSLIGRVMASEEAKRQTVAEAADTTNADTHQNGAAGDAGHSSSLTTAVKQAKKRKPRMVSEVDSHDVVFTIDTDALKRKGMVSHDNDKANPEMTNEYRSIKHKILYNAFGPAAETITNSNMVMVSSTAPNEGKTFTSVNLALSVASEKDKTVLLVDADVLKPSVSAMLGIKSCKGLIDYLLGEVEDIADVIYDTNIPHLRILPAGAAHHLSNELLSSDKMAALAQELATRYSDRIMIFDCPPLLGVIETITVSKFMGQAMIVVEQSKTSLSNIDEAISMLNRDIAMGFIINKATHGNYSQYGYGYGYGKTTDID
ncbi:XrtA-associated tyrosine autokinase [Photobacterium japonica]|uniref:XrtA-associated tyrosine autokinase n=1 Tax=Photobacterium japonica TaxID=2910235 RepID=UPI003D1141C2